MDQVIGGGPAIDDTTADAALDAALAPDPTPTPDPTPEPAVSDPIVADPAPEGEVADPAGDEEIDPAADELLAEDDSETDAAIEGGKPVNPLDLASTRGQRIYRSYKALKEINEGLGQDLTPETAKQHFAAYTDMQAMELDFSSKDPAHAVDFARHWNQVSPDGMQAVASQLPELFATQNPQAYQALAMPIFARYLSNMYARANAEQNPQVKDALAYAARMVEWDLTGKFRDDAAVAQAQQVPQRDQVDSRLQELRLLEQRQQAGRQGEWNQTLDKAIDSTLGTEADKVLGSLKKAITGDRPFQAARTDFINAVKSHLAKDVDGDRSFSIAKQQAARTMSREDVDRLKSLYTQRASRAVRAVAPGFLKDYGVTLKTASSARHQQLAATVAATTSPNGGGKPVPQSIAPGQQKQYASNSEKMDDMLNSALGLKK